MTKTKLRTATAEAKSDTKTALQTVYNALNQGQQKKIVRDESVKAIFDLYGVEYNE
jgi:Fe2+ or Zn2+ uptake regulation protein